MFADRYQAGRALAAALLRLAEDDPAFRHDPVVVALPRGGVPVAAEVAKALSAPMDLVMVRKIGVPWQPELAAAAIVEGAPPVLVRNEFVIRETGLTERDIEAGARKAMAEIERRRSAYMEGRDRVPLEGRTVIVVDDGIATGVTVHAALQALRKLHLGALVLAVPVAPHEGLEEIEALVDRLVVLEMPSPFHAVGAHYWRFDQVSDEEVRDHLEAAERRVRRRASSQAEQTDGAG